MPVSMSSDCTCIALRTASRKVTVLYDEALAPFGITLAQYGLMRRIADAVAISLTELGRRADLDRSTVGRNVRLLQKAGLVDPRIGEDQREAQVALSEAGQAVLAAARPAWLAAEAQIEARIGAEGVASLRSLAALL